jgi:protein SCO1/2
MKLLSHFVIVLTVSLLIACGTQTTETDSAATKRYPLKGEVLTLDKASKKASIKHEKIEGYMDAMTMDFEIRKPDWVWDELVPGSVVTGDLVVDNAKGDYWLEVTGVVAPQNGSQDASVIREDKAAVGKQLIDFTLTNQDGKTVSPNDFAGKALAITFIYSQCPLPEFCILMSRNFSDIANTIVADEKLKEKMRLLSISFDPARDTPEKLRSYGLGYLGKDSKATDFTVWQLAVGKDEEIRKVADFAGLRYEVDEKDKTQFNHSLRTMIVDPQGKVVKVLTGNDWKPGDLIDELKIASGDNKQ